MSQIAERPIEAPPTAGPREAGRPSRPSRAGFAVEQPAWSDGMRAWAGCHPDLVLVSSILAIGLLMRLALLYRIPPLFMPGDSQSFLTPAYDLARGLPFDPILKRPLGYPLLLSAVISLLGEDLRALVFIQAMLGLLTVAATYWLGRLTFGRAAGTLAALSVAVGGQVLIYEHYVLAESIFATLLSVGLLACVASVRCPTRAWRLAAAGGAALALASLFRPISEVVVPLLPIYFLVAVRPPRRAWLLSGIAVVGFVGVMLPALLTDVVLRGGLSSGALGEHLLWRLIRSDSGYITRADLPPGEPDSPQAAARRYVIRRAIDRALPQEIFTGLRRELEVSPGDADAIMRAVALEAIGRQPGRYVTSTVRMWGELFFAEDQRLGEVSKKDGEAGYINPQARQRTWFEDRILHLGEPPSQAVEDEFDRAERLTSIYQPARFAWVLLFGAVVAGLVSAFSVRHRPAMLLALAVPPMLLADVAIAGPEARFRYPVDPLIAILAFGGLSWLTLQAVARLRRRRTA